MTHQIVSSSKAGFTPRSWNKFFQSRQDALADTGGTYFHRLLTLDSAQHTISGTVERVVHFPFTTRAITVTNKTSGSITGLTGGSVTLNAANNDIEVRAYLGHVQDVTVDGVTEAGSPSIISGGFYVPLKAYNESHTFNVAAKWISISLAQANLLNVTGSVLVAAELTPFGTGSAPNHGGIGITNTGSI